jgi:HSP20 family protein
MANNMIRYNPFNEVVSLRDAMDRLFEDSFISRNLGNRGMTANLYETAEGFILQVPMPGANPEAVEITAQQDTLSLKWETKVQAPQGATVHWNGFQSGQYQQAFTLPAPINADRAEASYEDGVLTLNLPKAEHVKARTVKVTANMSHPEFLKG